MDIPLRIKELINLKGIQSINELGRICDIPQSTLATIMQGKTSPRLDTLERIANGLGSNLLEFLSNSNENKNSNNLFSYSEIEHINKYRVLDERGKQNVDETLEREYKFSISHKTKKEVG